MYSYRLKELREDKDLRQYEISKLLGFTKEVYGNFERENTIMPIKHLNFLCNYFNVSFDYLFEFTNSRKYHGNKKEINKDLMRDRLRELRKENNLSQKELANSIKVAPSTISDYERKAKIIATPFLYDISKKYNISADYLLGKTNNPKYLK